MIGNRTNTKDGGVTGAYGTVNSTQFENTVLTGRTKARHEHLPDFAAVNRAVLRVLPTLVARWLPDGRRIGREWVAKNPRRADRNPGSFRVNLISGRWADFALEDAKGGDPVSLAAYLSGKSQSDAARALAKMLWISPWT